MPEKIETEKLCDWGCGKTAEYYFPYSKKYCCGHNVSKCPSKNQKMVETRKRNGSFVSGAKKGYETKKNTVCTNGKTVLENATEKFLNTILTKDENGESISTIRAKKMVETRRNDVDENGLDLCKRVGKKQSKTKSQNVDENGVNAHVRAGRKGLDTKRIKDKNGLDWFDKTNESRAKKCKEKGLELHEKRLGDIDENGMDHYARRTQKMLNDIDEDGLNAIERAHKKSDYCTRKKYKGTDIHYQGSHEKHFLDTLVGQHGLEWLEENVGNGVYIKYWHPTEEAYRYYIPDFIIGNKLYEIKSSYTWDKRGEDNDLKNINESKLNAAVSLGYNVYLVKDKEEILWI